jgi:hypothetical protein
MKKRINESNKDFSALEVILQLLRIRKSARNATVETAANFTTEIGSKFPHGLITKDVNGPTKSIA